MNIIELEKKLRKAMGKNGKNPVSASEKLVREEVRKLNENARELKELNK